MLLVTIPIQLHRKCTRHDLMANDIIHNSILRKFDACNFKSVIFKLIICINVLRVGGGVLSAQLFYPSALRAGGVLSSRSGRAGGCQTCGTHISVTAWWIFSIRSSVELSKLVGVHCHGHMPICPIWACPWAKNLSNLPQIGSRLCGTHISETAGWIYPI